MRKAEKRGKVKGCENPKKSLSKMTAENALLKIVESRYSSSLKESSVFDKEGNNGKTVYFPSCRETGKDCRKMILKSINILLRPVTVLNVFQNRFAATYCLRRRE